MWRDPNTLSDVLNPAGRVSLLTLTQRHFTSTYSSSKSFRVSAPTPSVQRTGPEQDPSRTRTRSEQAPSRTRAKPELDLIRTRAGPDQDRSRIRAGPYSDLIGIEPLNPAGCDGVFRVSLVSMCLFQAL